MSKAKTAHIKGNSANNFMAKMLVDSNGERALENTSGPMRAAVEAELERRALKDKVD